MNEIPIFDSLTHPTPEGNWLDEKYAGLNTVNTITKQMEQANIKWALAVGMGKEVGGYEESSYARFINDHSCNVYPVAYIDYPEIRDLEHDQLVSYIKSLVDLGYVGIKLHPRFGRFSYSDELVSILIKIAAENGLAVLLCTYCWSDCSVTHNNTPFALMELLTKVDGAPVILLHGGGVRLLEFVEIARVFPNVLLDLSYIMCKYRGSSIDLDIKYVFKEFDRRVCIGSDSPEFSLLQLREAFNFFSKDVDYVKLENIAYKNILNFIPSIKE